MDDQNSTLAGLIERVGSVAAQANAAHSRIDRMESLVRQDLQKIETALSDFTKEMKPVVAWMNRSKGWAGAGYFIATVFGGALTALVTWILRIGGSNV